ncbi:hypothetical protein HHE014_11860 [Helicobacter heilmannii]|nr:hypothetical protein HHE014_11860 [Helicobacter heilmannii]
MVVTMMLSPKTPPLWLKKYIKMACALFKHQLICIQHHHF